MNIGVIGAGTISEIYLQNMTTVHKNLTVLGVADLNREAAEKRAAQFGIKAYTVDELLADPAVEMVVNLTPVGAHYSVIRSALEAGKHVYTEKTITNDSAKARELMHLAEEKGLYLGSAPDTFMGNAIQAARTAIDDGLLGEIHSFAISANRNNDVLLSLFAFLRQPGTGVLLDYGVYYVTALASLLGPVARVGGIVGAPYKTHRNILPGPDFGKEMDTPNESQVSAILQLKNGITGTFHIDTDSNMFDETYFAIYGTKGILYLSDPNQFGGDVRFQPNYMDPSKPVKPISLWKFTPYDGNARGIGPAEMAEAIEQNRVNRTSKEMAAHVLEVLEAILAGGENGKIVEISSTFTRPEPLLPKAVDVKNFGHVNFQVKNAQKMQHFYMEVLGMKPQFTLTVRDLAKNLQKQYGDAVLESLKPLLECGVEVPWIQYFKLADRQFLEFFYDLGNPYGEHEPYDDCYGFKKLNYEVSDIAAMHKRITDAGVAVKDEIHPTADGSLEFSVLDPDGNEIQFTQYTENTVLPLAKDNREVVSPLKCTTQVAFQIHDEINMMNFYTRGLGLKKAYTLTYGDLATYMEKMGIGDAQTLGGLRMMAVMPCIDYIKVGPNQFIEFFYTTGQEKKEQGDRSKLYGFQHICLEVPDIHAAWDAVCANGIKPDTEIALGAEGAYQFWLTDPDGNKLELMEYAEGAMQLL